MSHQVMEMTLEENHELSERGYINPKKRKPVGNRAGSEIKVYTKKLKKSHAFIGEHIIFQRKMHMVKGTVIGYREHSVIAEISQSDADLIEIKNTITVVNHKNYELL